MHSSASPRPQASSRIHWRLAPIMLAFGALGFQAQAATPQSGGVLKVALAGDPQCVDPHQPGNNTALNIARQITDSLTDQDPKTGAIVPWLATDWKVEDNSRRFTFVLRDGVTFADGTPVDADAVKANFEGRVRRLGAKPNPGPAAMSRVWLGGAGNQASAIHLRH